MADPDLDAIFAAIGRGTSPHKLEGERLDFKLPSATVKGTISDLTEAAVCFANAAGGTIVVGVRDRPGGMDALAGVDLDASLVRRRVYELTQPGLTVDVSELSHAGVRLLAIRVPAGVEVHATTKGYAHRRLGTDCVPMSPDAVARLSEERRGADWAAFSSGRDPSEVDPRALAEARRLVREAARPTLRGLARRSDADLLRALGLARNAPRSRCGGDRPEAARL